MWNFLYPASENIFEKEFQKGKKFSCFRFKLEPSQGLKVKKKRLLKTTFPNSLSLSKKHENEISQRF